MKTAKKKDDPVKDNSGHEKTRDTLRESDRKYRELVKLLPQTVFEIDRNGKITFVNPVALDTFGFTEEEFNAGVNVFSVFAQEDHTRLVENIHKILSGEKLSGIEYTARKKDGRTFPVVTFSVPVILDNVPVGLRGVLIDISERKAAEEALRESRDLYQILAESSPEMVYLIDRKGYITYVNTLAARQFMKNPADLIGKHLDEVFPPDVAQQHLEGITRTIETGKTQSSEILESFPGGDLWVRARLSPVKDAAGEVTHVLGISVDITEQKMVEDALKESEGRYRTIFENTGTAMVIIEEDTTIGFANNEFFKLTGYSQSDIDAKKSWTEFVYRDDLDMMVARHRNRREQSRDAPRQYEFRLIHKSGDILDILLTIDMFPGTARSIASLIDITDRNRVKEALRESEEKYRSLAEATHDIIVTTDFDGIITYANPAARNLVGEREIIGVSMKEFIPEDLIERHKEMLNARRQGFSDTIRFEWKITLPGAGSSMLVDVVSTVLVDKGKPSGILFNIRDITERRKSEEDRLQALSLLEATLESTADGILVVNTTGKIVNYNKKFAQMWQIPKAVLATNDDTLALNHVLEQLKDPEGFLQKIRELYATPLAVSFDTIVFRDGRIFERYSQPQRIGGTVIGRVWSFRDVTERNRAEGIQRETAAALTSIFRAAPIGIGVVTDRIIQRVNARLCEMTGYSMEELIGKSARILYPDDKEFEYVGTEKYARIREHGTGSVETRWKFRDGSIHDILLSSTPLDPRDIAAGVTFTAMDITERKRAEEALRESEEKYRVVAEMAKDGIAIVQGYKVVYVNPGLANLVGYPVEEIIGKSIIPFLSQESVFDLLTIMKKSLLGEPVPNFFLTHIVHRDGHKIEIEANGTTILWDGKKAHLGIIRDVTERNRIEEELRKYSENLEEMVAERTEKLNKSIEEKEVLLREVHHRVKNNLQIIISLLNLQSRYITDEKTLAAIRESQNRVKAMALVHEKLHQSTDISKINLDDYIKFLANSLFRFYGMTGKGLRLTTDIQDIYLDINTTIPLGLITNELVSNSLKYAFPKERKGEISIAITQEDHVLTVVFRDNGVGIPPELDWRNAKSLGLRLVISLVEQLQGTIELDRTSGTVFTMVLHEKP